MASNGFDPITSWARLSERVENQGKDIIDLRSNMNTGFQTLNSAIGNLSNELRSNSKTQWPVIWAAAGVCFTVLVTIGTFFYSTLSKDQDKLGVQITQSVQIANDAISKLALATQASVQTINDKMDKLVTQKDLEYRQTRGQEDRARTDQSIADIRNALVPRAELERVWHSQDLTNADFQRQFNELKDELRDVERERPRPQ